MTILDYINTWIGRGILGFLIAYLFMYMPYARNHYGKTPSIEFQIFLLIVCIALGKVAFWVAVVFSLLNIEEWNSKN